MVSHKIVVRLIVLMAWAVLWPSMPMLIAVEVHQVHPLPLYDCFDSVRRETGEVLRPDYAMNPYYLRLDLDGDGDMDYITILVDESGKVRRGLLVCSSEGKATFYQGAENRVPSSSAVKCPPIERVVEDLVLTEERSSQSRPPKPYLIMKCCEADGEMTTDYEKSSQTIPVGIHWYALPKSDLLQGLKYYRFPIESVEPAGESVGSIWEVTESLGFLDGSRFRWLIVTIADCPE